MLRLFHQRYDLIIGASNFNYKTSITREQWEQSMETTLKKEDPNPIRHTNSEYWEPSRDRSLLQLTVLVDDVIDEKPKFKQSVYVAAVEVGASPGFKIIQVIIHIVTSHLPLCFVCKTIFKGFWEIEKKTILPTLFLKKIDVLGLKFSQVWLLVGLLQNNPLPHFCINNIAVIDILHWIILIKRRKVLHSLKKLRSSKTLNF